eukprot:2992659-Pleurochrysis_carterae.AAC.1
MEKWPRRAWTRFSKCPSNCPTCPLARSTASFSPVTAYTKVSEASVRDGVVCGALADADVVVIRKYKAQLVVQ